MSTEHVILGAWFKHDETGVVMQIHSASAPECDDFVELSTTDHAVYREFNSGFQSIWRGSWDTFLNSFTRTEKP
jgi:hypothetical protein